MSAASIYRSAQGEAEVIALYEKKLASLAVETHSRMVDTRFGHTHVLAAGPQDAPPVMVLTGISTGAPRTPGMVPAPCPGLPALRPGPHRPTGPQRSDPGAARGPQLRQMDGGRPGRPWPRTYCRLSGYPSEAAFSWIRPLMPRSASPGRP